jgi:serine/threonine-protein kinase
VERFLREGKAAARITSEHVARVIDTGKLENGAPYLVMEHLSGADLAAVSKGNGPIPWSDAVDYVLQASEAIVEAHSLGIVHRDLKPANLFLTKRADGTPLVKVLDFGISKVDGGSRRDLTTASMLMGSPRYMSPEQMLSAKDVDVRTDVWALGVILYELVAGRPVWEADTVHGLSALIATAPAPSLRATAPDAPAVLDDVFQRCLTKKRDQRIASVADLALALESLAPERAHRSVDRILKVAGRARPSIITAEPPRAVAPERSKTVVPIIASVVGALLVLGIVLNVMAAKKSDSEPKPAALSAVITAEAPSAPPAASPLPSASSEAPLVAASALPVAKPAVVPRRTSAPPPAPSPPPVVSSGPAPRPAPTPSNRALVDRK